MPSGIQSGRLRVISTVNFMEDGTVAISYLHQVNDVRNRGLLVGSHTLHIAPGDNADYQQEIEDLEEAAHALLDDALEDFASTPPATDPTQQVPDDHDEDRDEDDDPERS